MVLIGAWVLLAVTAAPAAQWDDVYHYGDLTVWTRQPKGTSPIHELKAEAVVQIDAEQVWKAIDRSTEYPSFLPHVEQLKVVQTKVHGHFEYALVDAPMTAPRDYTVQVLRELDEERGVYRRAWVLANDVGPKPCEDCVRVRLNTGSWIVEHLAPGRCKLRYYLHLDPGGMIPAWLANLAHRRGLQDVYAAMIERASQHQKKAKKTP